jgi:hypothetical protein
MRVDWRILDNARRDRPLLMPWWVGGGIFEDTFDGKELALLGYVGALTVDPAALTI